MQKIHLLMVGKTSFDYVKMAEPELVKRIGRYAVFKTQIVKEAKGDDDHQKNKEGKEILKYLPESAFVVLLDEKGAQYNSKGFANWLVSRQTDTRPLYFVVGGANGFSEEVYQRADALLSMSTMTFSHQLIRIIFLEQLYRALTIIAGHPYHNE